MSHLPSVPSGGGLVALFLQFPERYAPLAAYVDTVMRGPSPLTPAERELVAAYVSVHNACGFCHDVHRNVAEAFGIAPELLDALVGDLATAPIDERLRTVLAYVEQVTTAPARITEADAARVLAHDDGEALLHDAVAVASLFAMVNRLVDGFGITADDEGKSAAAGWFAHNGYAMG